MNDENLMPITQVNSRRTREQHSRDSQKGGKASGNRNQIGAARIILQLIGEDKSPLDEKEQKARIEKLKAETRKTEQDPESSYAAGDDPITAALKAEYCH